MLSMWFVSYPSQKNQIVVRDDLPHNTQASHKSKSNEYRRKSEEYDRDNQRGSLAILDHVVPRAGWQKRANQSSKLRSRTIPNAIAMQIHLLRSKIHHRQSGLTFFFFFSFCLLSSLSLCTLSCSFLFPFLFSFFLPRCNTEFHSIQFIPINETWRRYHETPESRRYEGKKEKVKRKSGMQRMWGGEI